METRKTRKTKKSKKIKKKLNKYYERSKELYKYKARMQRGSLKNYDFDEVYDYYLYRNRPLKHPERSKNKKL
jgi:hypothetical protein